MKESEVIRCFFNDSVAARGNKARVFLALEGSSRPPARDTGLTQVSATPDGAGWTIESFTAAGEPIRFCGHGALAAAFVLFDRYPDADTLRCRNALHNWVARRAAGELPLRLQYEKPRVESVPVPAGVADWLGARVSAAAESGGEQGYLILHIDEPGRLTSLRPDGDALASLTSRAVIAACDDVGPADTAFRYFAPQYGVAEDAATGSAAVQLAAWRQLQTGRDAFVFHQRSVSGGWLVLRCNADTVELSGRVAYG